MPEETKYVRPVEFDVYATPDDYEDYEKIKLLIVKELGETEDLNQDMINDYFKGLQLDVEERLKTYSVAPHQEARL